MSKGKIIERWVKTEIEQGYPPINQRKLDTYLTNVREMLQEHPNHHRTTKEPTIRRLETIETLLQKR